MPEDGVNRVTGGMQNAQPRDAGRHLASVPEWLNRRPQRRQIQRKACDEDAKSPLQILLRFQHTPSYPHRAAALRRIVYPHKRSATADTKNSLPDLTNAVQSL